MSIIINTKYLRYVNKRIEFKMRSIKKYFKRDLIKLNITKIKESRIKTYYCYGKIESSYAPN